MKPTPESRWEREAAARRDKHRALIGDESSRMEKLRRALLWVMAEVRLLVEANREAEAREATRRVVDLAEDLNRENRR